MARKEPYTENTVEKLMIEIFSKTRDKLSDIYSQSLRDIVDYCLDRDPDKRPNIE
jgi:serine/threonine protein kinase